MQKLYLLVSAMQGLFGSKLQQGYVEKQGKAQHFKTISL